MPFFLMGLKSMLSPLLKLGASLVLPLLTDKLAKRAIYRLARMQADKYQAKARETPDSGDDKAADFFTGIVNDMGKSYGFED